MKHSGLSWLFWTSLGLLLFTYLGFPLLAALRGRWRARPVRSDSQTTPSVSVIIAAHNEARIIAQKIENSLALDYPRQRLEIIVASDGSDDGTDELVERYAEDCVRLLSLARCGKNATLDAAAAYARGEVLVFTDADTLLAVDALHYLIPPFSDPEVGGVTGDFRYAEDAANHTVWRINCRLKELLSQAGSVTVAEGQLHAIRAALFKPVPDGVIDDAYLAMLVPAAHRRLLFEPRAVAYPLTQDPAPMMLERKIRIMTRFFVTVYTLRRLLNPLEYGFFSLQLFFHKVMRRLTVLPALGLLISAPYLWPRGWIYRAATVGQLALHAMGGLGLLVNETSGLPPRLLRLCSQFELNTAAGALGLLRALSGNYSPMWIPARAGIPAAASGATGNDSAGNSDA